MTIWKNEAGLPWPLASAIMRDDYDAKPGTISVTGLILPPRIRQLERRHNAEMVEDVSEGIWRLIGTVGHKILERADTTNHLAEERLEITVDGVRVRGRADLLGPDMVLDDFKFVSVWAMLNEKPEWTAQLNVYAHLYRNYGFIANRARIVAVLRDWSKLRAQREPDYPQVGVVVREVPLWPAHQQEAYVRERVALHKAAEPLADDDLPLCTPEERWRKPDMWAVKKKGNKRAMPGGLKFSYAEAETLLNELVGFGARAYEIEHRPGTDTRCLAYCPVRQWCNYGKQYKITMVEQLEQSIEDVKKEQTDGQ